MTNLPLDGLDAAGVLKPPGVLLRQAAMQGNTTLLVQLVSLYPSHVDGETKDAASDGQAPLLAAALLGKVRCVEVLLSAGASQDLRGRRGETALMLAAQRGHLDVLRVLLACGSQTTATDQRGWTALHYAAFSGQPAAIKFLLPPASPTDELLELVNAKGETALALAAFGRKEECCRALLAAGARPGLLTDASDREYVTKLLPPGAADAADGDVDGAASAEPPAGRGGKKLGPRLSALLAHKAADGRHGGTSARPGIQFSGTADEYERLVSPQPSEPIFPTTTTEGQPTPRGSRSGAGGGAGPTAWKLHEYEHKGTPLLVHRPTGLLFTSVPEDSFPHLVGMLAGGSPRWLGESDLLLIEGTPQALEMLAATVPVAELLLRRLGVIAEPVLRLCLMLGLHEVSELRELMQLEPYSTRFDAAWRPAGLPPGHLAQLRPLLRAELMRPTGQAAAAAAANGASALHEDNLLALNMAMGTGVPLSSTGFDGASAGVASWLSGVDPEAEGGGRRRAGGHKHGAGAHGTEGQDAALLPVSLTGLPLVQHVLQRYGLAKLMVQVAEHQIRAPSDLSLLADPRRLLLPDGAGAPAAGGAGGPALTPAETGRLHRMLRELPGQLAVHSRERERAEMEAAVGPALEAAQQQRRIEALGRPTRGSLVAYDDLERLGAADGADRRPVRAAVVLQDDRGAEGPARGKFVVRDLESDRILHMHLGLVRKVRPADAAKLVRADYAPPASAGVPVTPLAAAPGLLVTRGSSWGRGPAYDLYGDGIVGELVSPEPAAAAAAEGSGDRGGGGGDGGSKVAERWRVRWPDGMIYSYSVGQYGAFELSFWGLHWRSGAPLLDSHRSLLLPPGEVAVLPVVRGPAWADEPHDGLPGSLGAAVLDRSTPGVGVDWLRCPHAHRSYNPAADSGAYPLLHAMMAGQPVSIFTARVGARVDPVGLPAQAAGGGNSLAGDTFYHRAYSAWRGGSGPEPGGPGTLVAPIRLEDGGSVVVWLVSWPKAGRVEARVCADPRDSEVAFAPLADTLSLRARLPHEHWHHSGAEGRLVRLNPSQLSLQPGAASGPLRPAGRSDVGIVLRDLGPGVHCGLLVRQLTGSAAFWYDEDVLLPLSPVEMKRLQAGGGAAAAAAAAALAGGAAAVPVLDCTAAPGMSVRRCYDDGSTLKCTDKEQQIGSLVAPVAPGRWLVRWPEGSSAVYHVGAGFKFQLSYVAEHPQAGAPLAAPRSLDAAAAPPASAAAAWAWAPGAGAAAVPGYDCCAPFAGAAGACDVISLESATKLDEPDKLRYLVSERLPVLVGPGAQLFRYSAGGLFRLYELSHAAVPGQPVTVFTARQGLRVMLQPPDARGPPAAMPGLGGGARRDGSGDEGAGEEAGGDAGGGTGGGGAAPPPMGTLTRPIRIGSKIPPRSETGSGGIGGGAPSRPVSAHTASPTPRRQISTVSRATASTRPDSARSGASRFTGGGAGNAAALTLALAPQRSGLPRSEAGSLGTVGTAAGPLSGGDSLDSSTVWWEVAWDNGVVSSHAVGVSPEATALRVAGQQGFRSPAPSPSRDARPSDSLLRIHEPVVHLPMKMPGMQILGDHVYGLASSLDTAVCALNTAAARLAVLWQAAAECAPAAPYRALVARVPMHGDTLLLTVEPTRGSLAVGGGAGNGPAGHLDPEEAQQLLRDCRREDEELGAAVAALEAALRGSPHLDLEAQRSAVRAELERRWQREAAEGSSAASSEDGGVGGGAAAAAAAGDLAAVAAATSALYGTVDTLQGRWPLAAVSYEDAAADAAVGVAAVPQSAAAGEAGGAADGGEGGEEDGGGGGVQLVASGPCSPLVAAALRRFNAALARAQAALDLASRSSGAGPLRYQVTVLPRPAAAALPLSELRLSAPPPQPFAPRGRRRQAPHSQPAGGAATAAGGAGNSGVVSPALVQELLEAFHAYSAVGLASAAAAAAPPMGPLELAALDLVSEVAAAKSRAHEAMSAYAAGQAAEWRGRIAAALAAAGGGADGAAKVDGGGAESEGARCGAWNGLALTQSSPPLLAAADGVSIGDAEGLVEPGEGAGDLVPSQIAARFNDALLALWRGAGRANRCGGSAHVADAVVKMYTYLHDQVSRAVASYGITFMAQDATFRRQQATSAVAAAADAARRLRDAADATEASYETAVDGDGTAAAAAARLREGAAEVWRLARRAATLAADVASAAEGAAEAADEQSSGSGDAATEELLQDAAAAAASATAATRAVAAAADAAAAAEVAADAACVMSAQAAAMSSAGGGHATAACVESLASAAVALAALAQKTAAAAKKQREAAAGLLVGRMDAVTAAAAALAARAEALAHQSPEAGGGERAATRLKEERDIAVSCRAEAEAHVREAAAARDAALAETEGLDAVAGGAARAAQGATKEAVAAQAVAAGWLVAAARSAGGGGNLEAGVALLARAERALAFANKVSSLLVPASVSASLAAAAAELCADAAERLMRAAAAFQQYPKDPDHTRPRQRALCAAAALLRQLQSTALLHGRGASPDKAAKAALGRAAGVAAAACRDVFESCRAMGVEAANRVRSSGGSAECCEAAAQLHLQVLEAAHVVEDLVAVTDGFPEAREPAREARDELRRVIGDNDSELFKVERYAAEHLMWRGVAVASALGELGEGFRRLPQALEVAADQLEQAQSQDGDAAAARRAVEVAWQGISEAEREMRRGIAAAKELMTRGSVRRGGGGGGETREAEAQRAKWAVSAAASLAGAATALVGAMSSATVQGPFHLMRLNAGATAIEDALRLLAVEEAGDAGAAVTARLSTATQQRLATMQKAAAPYGGVAAAQRAELDPSELFVHAADDGAAAAADAAAAGVPEVVFRPVFVQSARDPLSGENQIHFHVAVLIKEPGRRAAGPPPEVASVLSRPAVRSLLEPLDGVLEAMNGCLSHAQRALRDMASEADLLAPLLGLPEGRALLAGSRDGPAGLCVPLAAPAAAAAGGRGGGRLEALLRGNLRQAARHSGVAAAYRAVYGSLVEGMQDAAARLGELLAPIPVPYHTRRVAQERALAAAEAKGQGAGAGGGAPRSGTASPAPPPARSPPPPAHAPAPPSRPPAMDAASPRTRGSLRRSGSVASSRSISHTTRASHHQQGHQASAAPDADAAAEAAAHIGGGVGGSEDGGGIFSGDDAAAVSNATGSDGGGVEFSAPGSGGDGGGGGEVAVAVDEDGALAAEVEVEEEVGEARRVSALSGGGGEGGGDDADFAVAELPASGGEEEGGAVAEEVAEDGDGGAPAAGGGGDGADGALGEAGELPGLEDMGMLIVTKDGEGDGDGDGGSVSSGPGDSVELSSSSSSSSEGGPAGDE